MPLKRPAISIPQEVRLLYPFPISMLPEEKKDLLANAEKTIDSITKNFRRGLVTEEEDVTKLWSRNLEGNR